MEASIDTASSRILTEEEEPFHISIFHGYKHSQIRVVINHFREIVESPIILFRSGVPVPRLHQTDKVFRIVYPPACWLIVVLPVGLQIELLTLCIRHSEIARQHVIQCWDISGTLYIGMTAQR